MNTVTVEALVGFEHNGPRLRLDRFSVSEAHAAQLERNGLVRRIGSAPTPADPTAAAGKKPSASPAAPASAPKTAKPRASGAKAATPPAAAAPSSSSTAPSAPAPGPTSSTD